MFHICIDEYIHVFNVSYVAPANNAIKREAEKAKKQFTNAVSQY